MENTKESLPTIREQTDKEIEQILQENTQIEGWHLELAKILMLPKAKRLPLNEILRKFNIKRQKYYYWHSHPDILRLKSVLTKRYFHDDIPDILQAMRDEAIAGNAKSAELFFKYVDDWDLEKDRPVQVNILQIDEVKTMLNNFREKNI